MPDLKISQLTGGGAAQATDEIPIARSGANFKITGANIAAAATTIGASVTQSGSALVNQADIGSAPNEIPLNQYLGTMAYQDAAAIDVGIVVHAAGSATVPSLTATGDTNTGLFYPAADTVAVTTGGTERVRVDSSGNVGIGTASPSSFGFFATLSGATAKTAWFDTTAATAYSAGSNFGNAIVTLRTGANATGNATGIRFASSANGGFEGLFAYVQNASTYGDFVWQGFNGTYNERMRLDSSGNLGVGTATFGTSAAKVLGLANATEPSTAVADTIQFYSVDRSAGNTIPALRCEGTGVTDAGITNTTVTNKIAIKVNGTVYYLLATTNAT